LLTCTKVVRSIRKYKGKNILYNINLFRERLIERDFYMGEYINDDDEVCFTSQ